MIIVPLGKLVLQEVEDDASDFAGQVVKNIEKSLPKLIALIINEYLDDEVTRFLGRKRHQRRRHCRAQESVGECSKCHSRNRQKFWRNGHYQRSLATGYGQVRIAVAQLACECGGNVRYPLKTIGKGQRIWVDVQTFVQEKTAQGQSYRQIKASLDERLQSSVGLRTLNRQVLPLGQQAAFSEQWQAGEAPPVVRVDGIWLTVMVERNDRQTDQAGRLRPLKQARRIAILAAQGVWPQSGQTKLIGWMRAEGEDEASWRTFLEQLWDSGLTPENGLKLLISDGGSGFHAAYQKVYWMIPRQRCVFHKLKNLARHLTFAEEQTRQARKELASDFLRSASAIWQAEDKAQAMERYQAFCAQWQTAQPKAVQTLQRDFEATLAFYDVIEQARREGRVWPPHLLRTTSPLERMFREFRRRFRQAVLFHSLAGAQAATAQLASRFS